MTVKRKNPIFAAFLSFLFGPVGYFYIGWQYAIMACLVVVVFIISLILFLLQFFPTLMVEVRPWIKYPLLLACAWKAYSAVRAYNALIEKGANQEVELNTFSAIVIAMLDLCKGLVIVYAAAIAVFIAMK